MDRQRLALLLIVIFLFAGFLVRYGVDGFAEQPPTVSAEPEGKITADVAASLNAAVDNIKTVLGTQKSADAMPLKGTTQPADPDTVTMSATDFYDYLRPQILKTVTDVMNKEPVVSGSDVPGLKANTLANPMPAALGHSNGSIHSPAAAQGEDYSSCKPFNKNEWIRKDSIPCYACTL